MEYPNPLRNIAIRNATGVAKNIGVNIIPTVRGNRKIPTIANIASARSTGPIPDPKNDEPVSSFDHAAPRYEKRNPIPPKNPITAISRTSTYQILMSSLVFFKILSTPRHPI
jgi:hypothetical protein